MIRFQKLAIDDGSGEREEIGRNRKVDPGGRKSAERSDPEGGKSPEGEWRLGEEPLERASARATG